MTKEEATQILRANVMVACDTSDKVGYGTPLNKAIEQALDMAIKALEQQPSDDCVSRQAVKDIIHEYKNNIDSQLSWLSDGVCNLPPVTPTHGTCKDCKHREGIDLDDCFCAKHGNSARDDFYCKDFETMDNKLTYIDCQKCENFRNSRSATYKNVLDILRKNIGE